MNEFENEIQEIKDMIATTAEKMVKSKLNKKHYETVGNYYDDLQEISYLVKGEIYTAVENGFHRAAVHCFV